MTEALSLRDRIARMRPTGHASSIVAASLTPPPGAAPARQPTYAEATGKRERGAATEPAGTRQASAVFERMSRIGSRPTVAQPPVSQRATQVMQWDDASRPAGSVFTVQEWAAARTDSGFAKTIVIEIHKAAERALIALDAAVSLPVLHPSILDGALLIDERLKDHPAWHNADGFVEHRTEDLGSWRYRIVHSTDSLAANPWIHGARCYLGESVSRDEPSASVPAPRG